MFKQLSAWDGASQVLPEADCTDMPQYLICRAKITLTGCVFNFYSEFGFSER